MRKKKKRAPKKRKVSPKWRPAFTDFGLGDTVRERCESMYLLYDEDLDQKNAMLEEIAGLSVAISNLQSKLSTLAIKASTRWPVSSHAVALEAARLWDHLSDEDQAAINEERVRHGKPKKLTRRSLLQHHEVMQSEIGETSKNIEAPMRVGP